MIAVEFNGDVGPVEFEPRVLSTGFGDGVEQRARDGINTLRRVYPSVRWDALSTAEKTAIDGFFNTHGGYRSFSRTAPDDDTLRKYTCPKWAVERVAADVWNMSATIRQSFDI